MKKSNSFFMCGFTILLFLVGVPQLAQAAEKTDSRGIVHLTGNYHAEFRGDDLSADGFDVLAGFDFLLWDFLDLYAGPRLGWYTETVCTAYMTPELAMRHKPSIGAQIYLIYPSPLLKSLEVTAGLALDVLVNLDDLHSDPGERTYTFTAAFLGIRFALSEFIYVEGRLEAGNFPFFEDPPFFVKGGLQAGIHL